MATSVELATYTMLDPPHNFESLLVVIVMPDFQQKFADWMDWTSLTMLRGSNYSSSFALPAWQSWHRISAHLYGFHFPKPLHHGPAPLSRLQRWQALLHMLTRTAPPELQSLLLWWHDLALHIVEHFQSRPLSFTEIQIFFQQLISPSTETYLLEAINKFDWKVRYTASGPTPAQQQFAALTSELSLLWTPHPTLHRLTRWILLAWLD